MHMCLIASSVKIITKLVADCDYDYDYDYLLCKPLYRV